MFPEVKESSPNLGLQVPSYGEAGKTNVLCWPSRARTVVGQALQGDLTLFYLIQTTRLERLAYEHFHNKASFVHQTRRKRDKLLQQYSYIA